MPEAITSCTCFPPQFEPEPDDDGLVSSPPPTDVSTDTPTDVLEEYVCLPVTRGNNNAQRTSERPSLVRYVELGITEARDGVFMSAAAVKGRDARTGIGAELMAGSVQVGAQSEVYAGIARVSVSKSDGTASIGADMMTVRAGIGRHNSDRSIGANAGALATAVGVEGTVGHSGYSATGGLSVSVGAEGSIGVRDQDGDGKAELCGRASLLFFTLGACVENPF